MIPQQTHIVAYFHTVQKRTLNTHSCTLCIQRKALKSLLACMDTIANRNLHICSNLELEFSHTQKKKRVTQTASNILLIVMRKTM